MSRLKRKRAAEMFERGLGYKAVSTQLSINRDTVRDWYAIWRALGTEDFLKCYRSGRRSYPSELKLAVVREPSFWKTNRRSYGSLRHPKQAPRQGMDAPIQAEGRGGVWRRRISGN